MMDKKALYWVPSLYFFQSIPFALVSLISLMLYQQMGFSNSNTLLMTSLFMLPWSLKLFIVPFLENGSTKKKLIVRLQMLSALLCLLLALTMNQTYFIPLSMVVFSLLALVSSTHDIVADALYLCELDSKTQNIYVGVRTIFFQIGVLLIKGGLFIVLAPLALYYQLNSWSLFFLSVGCLVSLLTLYHHYQLPHTLDKSLKKRPIKQLIQTMTLFSQKHLGALSFIFFYNVSTAPMQKIIPLFLLDIRGLNLNLTEVGAMYGVWGMSILLLGVFVSGFFVNRYSVIQSIKGCTLLLALGQGLFLSVVLIAPSWTLIFLAVLVTQFFTGLASGAYMGYLLALSNKSQNPMSAYTLCTSLMALSGLFFGAVSGIILNFLDFESFFLLLFLASLVLVGLTFSKGYVYE